MVPVQGRPRAPTWLRNLTPGRRLFVLYDSTEGLWHERLLGAQLDDWCWGIVTPSHDCYIEDFYDAEQIIEGGTKGGLPRSLYKKPLFRFEHSSSKPYRELLARAADLVAAELEARRRARGPGPRDQDHHFPVQVLPPEAGAPSGLPLDDPDVLPGARGWVALEARAGFNVGDPVPVKDVAIRVVGDRAIIHFKELGTYLAVASADTFVPTAGGTQTPLMVDNVRILPTKRNAGFNEAAGYLTDGDNTFWKIKGPQTMRWLCQAHVELNMGPVQRHWWWRQVLHLLPSDAGVDEHLFLAEAINTAITQDGINVSACECFEQVSGRFMLWEEFYSASLRAAESGDDSTGDWLDERRVFLGASRAKGQALVSPELETHVASRLREEAEVLKERRKAREERRLARPGLDTGAAPDGDGGAGGAGGSGGNPKRGGRKGGRG